MKFKLSLFAFFIATIGMAQVNVKNGIALQGYDPVSYFEKLTAEKGSDAYKVQHNGAWYYFTSEAHKVTFEKNPSYYEPQFGGYCAYGMSKGYKAAVQPEAFTIYNEKLYLNYNLEVRVEWMKNKEERIQNAEKNWKSLQTK
ncbi:MAG: hypothetical protein RLZZ500_1715 [Bacteroidota bacterium]|jgi:YHS domain-containing protein